MKNEDLDRLIKYARWHEETSIFEALEEFKNLRSAVQGALNDHSYYPQLRMPKFQVERLERALKED